MHDHPTIGPRLDQEQRGQVSPTYEVPKAKNLLENAHDTARVSKHVEKPRTLLVISVQPTSKIRTEIAAGRQPRRDYDALRQALGADVLYPDDVQGTRFGRLIERFLGPHAALIWATFRRRHTYDILYTDTEIIGLPLAMLLKLSRTRIGYPRHVTLSHYLTPPKKRIFFWLGVGSHIDTVIVHSAAQRALATKRLHLPDERVVKLPYFVDEHFWRPLTSTVDDNDVVNTGGRPMICAAGLEFRDYPTLLTAVRDLDVKVQIAAGSAAAFHRIAASSRHTDSASSYHRHTANVINVPPNVSVGSFDYVGMRQLYSAARFVVVPLLEVDFQAGVTVILEAMAMGKAVIVSGTRGQTDVLRDLRNDGRGPIAREWWPSFLETSSFAETLGRLATGFYVTPGDPDELRGSIQYLLDHPEVAEELGRNGRRVAAYFSLDAFAKRFAAAIRGEHQPLDVIA